MTTLLNGNKKTGTDYSENLANGVKYKTQEEAVMANAKAYAKLDWTTTAYLAEEIGIEANQELADALVRAKARIIRESIEKTNKTGDLFK